MYYVIKILIRITMGRREQYLVTIHWVSPAAWFALQATYAWADVIFKLLKKVRSTLVDCSNLQPR